MRILVVEDEKDLTDAVARGLQHEGYAVDVAYSGGEALEKIGVNHYDLICLDLNLPEIGGLEIARTVRSDLASGDDPGPR
ncbi:MAG: response regulator, partial [Actinomycetota bacterium]